MKIFGVICGLFSVLLLAGALVAEERVFQVSPGGRLTVDLKTGGNVQVTGSATGEARIRWEAVGGDATDVRVRAESASGQIYVATENSGRRNFALNFWISVPSPFDLELLTRGGNISVAQLEGSISGETKGGNLSLAGVKGKMELSTLGGNISLADSSIDGSLATKGGNIIIRDVAGDVSASTHGGNVILNNVVQRDGFSINSVVNVSTMGGNIEVANAPHGANVETKGGNIVIQKAGEFVQAKTMGGNIVIKEHDGRITAETMGGNVSAVIVSGSSDQNINLRSMGGSITLTLPSGFSGNFDLELAYTRKVQRRFEIRSDFPIQIEETPDWDSSRGDARRYIRGTGSVGGGVNKVIIRTNNGDIVIRKN